MHCSDIAIPPYIGYRTVYAPTGKKCVLPHRYKIPEALSASGFLIILGIEPIHGFAVEVLALGGDGLDPLGAVQGVGEELGLQGYAAALAVDNTVLALLIVDEVAGIELNAGQVGVDHHGAAAVGGGQDSGGVGIDLEIVVVAALQVQGLVVGADIPANGLCGAEIEGGALHTALLAGGDVGGVIGAEEPAGDGQQLVHGSLGVVVARQVEVAVVGGIKDGILIAVGVVDDVQGAVGVQLIGDPDHGVAGEALVAIGTVQAEGDGIIGNELHIPQPLMPAVGAGMEGVAVFVVGEADNLAVQRKGCTGNAVGTAAHGGAEVAAALPVAVDVVVAKDHVSHTAVLVGGPQADQGGAVVGDVSGDTAAGDGVQGCLLTIGQGAERFCHDEQLLSVFEENGNF